MNKPERDHIFGEFIIAAIWIVGGLFWIASRTSGG
jgi:hypothetical protein